MIENYNLVRLTKNYTLKSFNCDDTDLNEFYTTDSFNYLNQLLSVTYIFETDNKAVAFYSVSNDRIINSDAIVTKSRWKSKIQDRFPYAKRRYDYPAVKIGRLGVCKEEQGSGIGTEIIDFIKASFTTNNKTGCRFIVVDAYNKPKVIRFYEKNGFAPLSINIKPSDDTVLMFYDLYKFIEP